MYGLVLIAHVAVGVVALAAYWTAGFASKGSPVHRGAGKLFMAMMLVILATALVFVARMLSRDAFGDAAFFAYLIVISGTALACGWFSLKLKRAHRRYFGGWYRALAVFNIACGAGVLALGISGGNPILMGFSSIGLLRGASMLRLSWRAESPRWWLREHLGAMIGNGVAVHVAFLLVGLNRLLPASWHGNVEMLGWLLPLAVSGVALVWFGRRYRAVPQTKPAASANVA